MFEKPLVIIDFETSGMSPDQGGRAIEVAALRIEGNQITDRFVSLMNSGVEISPFITNLTGINQQMVNRAPMIDRVMPELLSFIGEDYLVAHNASFDEKFLLAEAARVAQPAKHQHTICTVKLARRVLPGFASYSLGALSQQLRIPFSGNAHRAEADAEVTAKLLLYLAQYLSDQYQFTSVDPELLRSINQLAATKVNSYLRKMSKQNVENGDAQARLDPMPQYFQHYKGGIYEVIAEATHEADLTPVIVYKAPDGSWWTRNKSVFFENVDINGVKQPRFAPLHPALAQQMSNRRK